MKYYSNLENDSEKESKIDILAREVGQVASRAIVSTIAIVAKTFIESRTAKRQNGQHK